MQCYTSYPTLPQQWGLNEISLLKDKYNIPIGYSDHSGNIYSSLAATALGAEIIEFHVCFDKEIFGPDTKSSITINQVKSLVVGIKEIKESLSVGSINKKDKKLKSIKDIFSKSLALKRDLKKGDKLSIDDLESKKPANMGISAEKFKNLLGKHLKRDMLKGEFLNLKDIK